MPTSRFNSGVARGAFVPLVLLITSQACREQIPPITAQVADSTYLPIVQSPTYLSKHPHVLIDEAHNNFHKADGRYQPFVQLLTSDGYRFSSNLDAFTPDALEGVDVLVIANASGGTHENEPDSVLATGAFTAQEVGIVREWVERGGALLLIADHAPSGAAAQSLATAFDVEMSNSWTFDESHGEPGYGKYNIAFSRSNGLLAYTPSPKDATTGSA